MTDSNPIPAMRQQLNPYEDLLVSQCMKASPVGFSLILALSAEEAVNSIMETLDELCAMPEDTDFEAFDRVIRAHAKDIRRDTLLAAFQSLVNSAAEKAVEAQLAQLKALLN